MLKIAWLALGLCSAAAQAAPQQIHLEYEVYRNGNMLGSVTDTFIRSGNQYRLVSEMHATGPLKALWPGKVRFESRGDVTPQGLLPLQFKHARSDAPNKLATASLDWKLQQVQFQYKDKSTLRDGLQPGTQDQLSMLYQFAFMPRLPTDYTLQVVSGKGLKEHHYARSDGGLIRTPAGQFATQHYQRVGQAADDKSVDLWIAPARHNLPVQVRISEDGDTFVQRLVRYRVKG